MSRRSQRHRFGAAQALLLAALATVLLYLVPHGEWIAWPLILLSTLVHELGHGLTALLVGGRFLSLMVWPDASGVAAYGGSFGALARATVAAGGLLAPPLAAAGLFLAGRRTEHARRALVIGAVLLLLVAALWVRNGFGLAFVILLALGLLALALKAATAIQQIAVVFLAIQLSLAVFARADYLFMRQAHTAQGLMPSDTGQIEQALLLPYWVWGALVAALSMAILAAGLQSYARSLR